MRLNAWTAGKDIYIFYQSSEDPALSILLQVLTVYSAELSSAVQGANQMPRSGSCRLDRSVGNIDTGEPVPGQRSETGVCFYG